MKLTIKDDTENEPEIKLELVYSNDNVRLMAHGTLNGRLASKVLLVVRENGTIFISPNAKLDGMSTDIDGRIVIELGY